MLWYLLIYMLVEEGFNKGPIGFSYTNLSAIKVKYNSPFNHYYIEEKVLNIEEAVKQVLNFYKSNYAPSYRALNALVSGKHKYPNSFYNNDAKLEPFVKDFYNRFKNEELMPEDYNFIKRRLPKVKGVALGDPWNMHIYGCVFYFKKIPKFERDFETGKAQVKILNRFFKINKFLKSLKKHNNIIFYKRFSNYFPSKELNYLEFLGCIVSCAQEDHSLDNIKQFSKKEVSEELFNNTPFDMLYKNYKED